MWVARWPICLVLRWADGDEPRVGCLERMCIIWCISSGQAAGRSRKGVGRCQECRCGHLGSLRFLQMTRREALARKERSRRSIVVSQAPVK